MEQDLEKAIGAQDEAEEALNEFINEGRARIAIRESSGRGRPVNDKFVRHARTLLSTGGSARSTLEQLHLNAGFFLSEKEYELFLLERAINTMVSVSPRGAWVGELPLHPDAHSQVRARATMGL